MGTWRTLHGVISRFAYMGGVLVPFLAILFLCVEPARAEGEDYLPSSPSRLVTVKIFKSLKSFHGGKAGNPDRDLTADGYGDNYAIYQTFILVEPYRQILHFGFLTNRLGRSPPSSLL